MKGACEGVRMGQRPQWTRLTALWVRPMTEHTWSERGAAHRAIRHSLIVSWPDLEAQTWRPLYERARQAGQRLDDEGSLWGRGGLPALVLEVAYWWAIEWRSPRSATQDFQALADELRRTDADLLKCASDMRELLFRKAELSELHGVATDWTGPGLDFLDLVREVVARMPRFEARVQRPLDEFIWAGRQTSVSHPTLADVMTLVCESVPGRVLAQSGDDRASLTIPAGSATSGKAAAVRRFFGQMEELNMVDMAGCELRPLDWLTNRGIAVLLSSAAGFAPDASPFNEEQVKKLRGRYRRE